MTYAYFDNRELVTTDPLISDDIFVNREVANKADCFVINGHAYNLHLKDDIEQIPLDIVSNPHTPAVIELSYLMKIRCQFVEHEVLLPFIDKTIGIMSTSSMAWRKKDYLQVIRNAYKAEDYSFGSTIELEMRNKYPDIFGPELVEGDTDEGEHLVCKYYYENKFRRYREYDEVIRLGINDVPTTLKGFLQIQARNTRRYNCIKDAATESGVVLLVKGNYHFCNIINDYVQIDKEYSHRGNGTVLGDVKLLKCECDHYKTVNCDGKNEYGLPCNYYNSNRKVKTVKAKPVR